MVNKKRASLEALNVNGAVFGTISEPQKMLEMIDNDSESQVILMRIRKLIAA